MTEHVKADWYNNEHNLPDGSYIDKNDNVCYVMNGKYHRSHGPAITQSDGTTIWCLDGKKHREDGPAVESVNGYKAWYKDGVLYKEDGQATTDYNGIGICHNFDKSTVTDITNNDVVNNERSVNYIHFEFDFNNVALLQTGVYINKAGDVAHVDNGVFHRIDGPAIVYSNGGYVWCTYGTFTRTNGPAVCLANGEEWWYYNGIPHRIGGPAHTQKCGNVEYYIMGVNYSDNLYKFASEVYTKTGAVTVACGAGIENQTWYDNNTIYYCMADDDFIIGRNQQLTKQQASKESYLKRIIRESAKL